MALFDSKPGSFMGRFNEWMTPERAIAFQGLGMGLSQLAAGQPANLSSAHNALMQRQQQAQLRRTLDESGVMERFTPEQRALIATMPPAAAQKIIAQTLFAKPEPIKGEAINGQLVNPVTGQVIGDYRDPQAAPERKTAKDANGRLRYVDTQELVFPEVEVAPEEPKPTDDMREYAFAQSQGYQGSFNDFMIEQRRAGASNVTVNGPAENLTKGQEKVDTEYATEHLSWTRGGNSDMLGQIAQLETVQQQLEQISAGTGDGNLTGPGVGNTPDFVRGMTNPDSIAARQRVEEVVQRNLKLILGSQFTQSEGDRLISRAYDEKLPEAENAARLRRLILAMRSAYDARQGMADYFSENGTLKGYAGSQPSMQDFFDALEGDLPLSAGAPPAGVPQEEWDVMTDEDKKLFRP